MSVPPPRTLVVGVGNESRGDDGVGLAVVRRLRERRPDGVDLRELGLDGTALLDALDGVDSAVIVDATASGAGPGTIARFDAAAGALPASLFAASTHALGVPQAIELARALGRLPRRVIVIGIEGASFVPGAALSPPVRAAVDRAVERVLHELAADGADRA